MEQLRTKAQQSPFMTVAIVVTLSVVLMAAVPSAESEPEAVQTLPPEQQLKVEGTGSTPQGGVGNTLQGASGIDQSPNSSGLQQGSSGLQPAGGDYRPGNSNLQ